VNAVIVGESRLCVPPTSYVLTSRRGYLSSAVADTTQRGTTQCPWVIEARPGQRINVTLWDFGGSVYQGSESTAAAASLPGSELVQSCLAYAVVRERAPARSFTVILCLHDQANIKEPSSKCRPIQNTRARRVI